MKVSLRWRKSLEKFGRVFDGIVNAVNKDGTYDLIEAIPDLNKSKGKKQACILCLING